MTSTPEHRAPEGGRPVSEMQERIAWAIWNIRRGYEDRCDMELEDMGRGHEVWAEALAAMKAMRAPTTEMAEAGTKYALTVNISSDFPWPKYVSSLFLRMLDAEISIAEGGKDGD